MTLTKLSLFAVLLLCYKQVEAFEYVQSEDDHYAYVTTLGDDDEEIEPQPTHTLPPYFDFSVEEDDDDDIPEYPYGYYGYPPMSYPDFEPPMPPQDYSVRPSFMNMMSNMYPMMSLPSDAPSNTTMSEMYSTPYPPPMYMPHPPPPPPPRPMMVPEMYDTEMQRSVIPNEMPDFEPFYSDVE